MKVASSRPVPPLGGSTEVRDALREQLLAVRAEEPDQRGEVQEAPVIALGYFDYEIPITNERSVVGYLDVPAGPGSSSAPPGVSFMEDRRVDRTRALFSPQAWTSRISLPSLTEKPELVPIKVAMWAYLSKLARGLSP